MLFVLWAICSYSQNLNNDLSFTGFIDTYHAVRSSSPNDFLSSRSRFRGEIKMHKGSSYLFTSFNVVHNSIIESLTGVDLREAFFDYSGKSFSLKAGRQLVNWGVADGMRITNIISAMDMTEFLAQDYDDILMPVNGIKLTWINTKVNIEIIFVPIPTFSIIPHSNENPWSIFPSNENPVYDINMDNKPDYTLDNSEYGTRISFFLAGIDFSFSALNTWNKTPVFTRTLSSEKDTLFVDAHYYRLNMLGSDFSLPKGEFVFRGEIAYYFNEFHEVNNSADPVNKSSANWLLGIDWYPGNEWTITSQYSHKFIPNYVDVLVENENTVLSTVGITKKIFRSTLTISTFAYIDLTNNGFYDRSSLNYSLSDEINIMLGYDWFNGEKGIFGYYNNNSEFWIKARYCF